MRVWSAGARTMIDFPSADRGAKPPALFVLRAQGELGSPVGLPVINTHWDERTLRLTVDSVVDRALLIAGIGNDETRVEITRRTPQR